MTEAEKREIAETQKNCSFVFHNCPILHVFFFEILTKQNPPGVADNKL